MKNITLLFFTISYSSLSFSQDLDSLSTFFNIDSTRLQEEGVITIDKDERIEELITNKSKIIPPATSPQITGYRIQLFFDTDKKEVDLARKKFIELYPEVETNVVYKAPNYFLKIGNFRTRLEAEKIKVTLDKEFPTNYILKELISLHKLD
jgi:hypothetical protein